MSSVDLLNIDERLKVACRKSKLTSVESILYLTGPVGSLSSEDIIALKWAASKFVCRTKPLTALDYVHSATDERRLTTGCEVLDQAFRGGILCHGITELSGESATGKTQFGLQVSLTAQLPLQEGGLNGGTLYICTEDAFPSKRLYQMIQNFASRQGIKSCSYSNFGDNIFIEHVADYDGLMDCLTKKAHVLLSSGAVKLLVLDSVAAHFRSDYDSHEMYRRAQHINNLGTLLYKLSQLYHVPVVAINQVTSSMNCDGAQLIPSLGLAWSNYVTTRIMLSRTDRSVTIQQDSARGPLETIIREIEIVFAPHLQSMIIPYVIDHEGMKGFK